MARAFNKNVAPSRSKQPLAQPAVVAEEVHEVAPPEEPELPPVTPRCNFCESEEFVAHMGREGERCGSCGSLRRHRIALEVYRRRGLLSPREDGQPRRVLHLGPEFLLRREVGKSIGVGYICADSNPEAFGNAQCLKLSFPEAFDIFPDDYFDYVIHNHVLDHIPGPYKDVLLQFGRIIKPWGYHIFSVRGPDLRNDTVEAGQPMPSEGEQPGPVAKERHFGKDLVDTMRELPNGQFSWDQISTEDRAALNVAAYSNRFMVWRKGRGRGLVTE